MKKTKLAVVLAVCVAVVFTFAGCGVPYSHYDLTKYIKVGKYKGLQVKAYTIKVTDKDVNKQIKTNLKKKTSTKNVTTGTVKKGDTVTIDYSGKVNGKSFDGGSDTGTSVTIGSGQFITGFESGLIGLKVGESKTLHLKFPSNYSTKKLAGKKVVYKVKVTSKQVQVTPTLTTKFVKENSSADTIAAYKKDVRAKLYASKKATAINNQKEYLWTKVQQTSTVVTKSGKEQYPEKEIKRVKKNTKKQYEAYAKQYSMTFSKFIKQQMGMTEKQFNTQLTSYAKMQVKQEEIVYYIANKQNIKVSKDQYKAYIKKTLKSYGYTEKSFKEANKKSYEDYVGKDNIYFQIYLNKVENYMLKHAKVVKKITE